MATSLPDYFGRTAARPPRPGATALQSGASPGSPRTPLLGRSISSQFGSPGSFRSEQEDILIYELGARHFSAGFALESRPRCILGFNPDSTRRVGDFRPYQPGYTRFRPARAQARNWANEVELYTVDVRSLDLGLVEDKLERAVRKAHADFLQLDQKPRKAMLVVPSFLPIPLLEIVLKVIFNHFAQPPSITIMTTPVLACLGAGLRNALVVDLGWEETVVTAVGEYKDVCWRRSVRARKMLTLEMGRMLQRQARQQQALEDDPSGIDEATQVDVEYAEEVTTRMAWCRSRSEPTQEAKAVKIPFPTSTSQERINVFFNRLAEPAETVLLDSPSSIETDEHDLTIPMLMYRTLLALPSDLRALCMSRIIFTGGLSQLPGLKHRLLQELSHIIDSRDWSHVNNYGSAGKHPIRTLRERSANINGPSTTDPPLSPSKKPYQETIPHAERIHDDKYDPITLKAEREAAKGKRTEVKGIVRGVRTIGAWAGASLAVSLRVKGAWEVEREDFLKAGGLKDSGGPLF